MAAQTALRETQPPTGRGRPAARRWRPRGLRAQVTAAGYETGVRQRRGSEGEPAAPGGPEGPRGRSRGRGSAGEAQ